jgi:uncharacterized membrane protein
MAQMAHRAVDEGSALPPEYARYAKLCEALGYPAFVAMAVIFYLMVNKPNLSF